MNNSENYESWSFVFATDIHIGSLRSYRFQPAWNENWKTARSQIQQRRPDLVLVGGDMTRDGSTHVEELVESKHDLETMGMPVHVIPGNHEVGNKWSPDSSVAIRSEYLHRYQKVYGASEWSFVQGTGPNTVRFTGLNAFLLGSGLPEEALLRAWLDGLERDSRAAHHVWMIHPSMFADRFDEADFDPVTDRVPWYFGLNQVDREYLWDVMRRTGVTQVLSGHIHCRRHVRHAGVDFYLGPATAFPQWGERWPDGDATLGFMEFTVSEGAITPEFVPLDRVSDQVGYGPGGNPPIEGRDYSVAREQPAFKPCRDED